jgi:hypothetical protein
MRRDECLVPVATAWGLLMATIPVRAAEPVHDWENPAVTSINKEAPRGVRVREFRTVAVGPSSNGREPNLVWSWA